MRGLGLLLAADLTPNNVLECIIYKEIMWGHRSAENYGGEQLFTSQHKPTPYRIPDRNFGLAGAQVKEAWQKFVETLKEGAMQPGPLERPCDGAVYFIDPDLDLVIEYDW